MNNSNAAAKRRRAGIQSNTPPTPQTSSQQSTTLTPPVQQGLTLQQVIALIDTRLVTLEKFMKDTKDGGSDLTIANLKPSDTQSSDAVYMDSKEFTTFVEEVNNRFQLFADEINNLKEIVLKLQGFTMDVNKMLLASLSNKGEPVPNIVFEIDNTDPEQSQTFNLSTEA